MITAWNVIIVDCIANISISLLTRYSDNYYKQSETELNYYKLNV